MAVWTPPTTLSLGTLITPDIWNVDLVENLKYLKDNAGSFKGARVYHNANQSINNNTWTALAMNSERFDTDVIHDNATNNSRLTCKTATKYLIGAHIEFASNVVGQRQLALWLNGATFIGVVTLDNAGTDSTRLTIASVYDLAVNDYVECRANQVSGGALNVIAAGNYTPEFWMVAL